MDRRTLIFVISLSLTLLFVNMFFEQRNQESLRKELDQHKAVSIEKRAALEREISQNTANIIDLPVVSIYEDEKETQFATSGVLIKNSILTLPWSDDLPSTVYVKGEPFRLTYSSGLRKGPALYEKNPEDVLPIGDLPLLGSYQLQLVTPYPKLPEKAPLVTLANFSEGQFSVPVLNLIKLNRGLDEEKRSEKLRKPGDSIVLLKTEEGYLPVATYQADEQGLLHLEQIADLKTETLKPSLTDEHEAEEKFFILEDAFQQLVFSSRGAALAEINLPFYGEKNHDSVVKEIGFDRQMVKEHPRNAMFPMHSYYTPGETPETPRVEHQKGQLGGYYPLIRRDLVGSSHQRGIKVQPEYYALNIVSEYPEMAELNYDVTYFDKTKIVFEATQRNRKITKTFALRTEDKDAPYCLDLTISIEGDGRGLWLTSGVPEVEIISNAPAPALKYRITRKGKAEVLSIDKPKDTTTVGSIYPDWLCNSNGFLGTILDPLTEIDPGYRAQYVAGNIVPSRLIILDAEYGKFKAQELPGYMTLLPLNAKGGSMQFRIFAGPFATDTLKTVDTIFSNPETGYNPDYIASQSFHGWFSFISAPFSKFLFVLMRFFHYLTGSWAFSIILLTVALRLMLYPLNAWSTKSMLKMQQISPEVQRIQEKYKKDPKRAQLEIMNLYRDNGVNPVSGCFPLLIQMPFLIGMFDLLKSTFELRGASFIPGWINNLAAPDVLFSWSTPIFFIGTEFHLLPFLLGGVMFLQQRTMSTMPKDPSQMTEQQRQQRTMGTMMTVVFTVMFYHFPSGLNIYWLSSMLLGILQQWWTQKNLKSQPVVAAVVKKSKK